VPGAAELPQAAPSRARAIRRVAFITRSTGPAAGTVPAV